jgi:serine/threonine-protein kinase HipA
MNIHKSTKKTEPKITTPKTADSREKVSELKVAKIKKTSAILLSKKCLGCYQKLPPDEVSDYHITCSKKLFSIEIPPHIDFGLSDLEDLAKKSIRQHLGITGVQPKVSVNVEAKRDDPKHRIMIVGLWGGFILKPPTAQFPDLSVVEDLSMHLAGVAGITTAKHGLIRLNSGELAYVTKRFDRDKHGKKIAVEDFCQLSESLTESKYNTSSEKASKIILKFATNSGLDAVKFFELNLFAFLIGNADMHLKNFSLMRFENGDWGLTPAYDLLSTRLMPLEDKEEMALTVNGKKAKLKRADFVALGKNLGIPEKVIENRIAGLLCHIPKFEEIIAVSFLNKPLQKQYIELIADRSKILG